MNHPKTQDSKSFSKKIFYHSRGILVATLLSINTAIVGTFLFISAGLVKLIPSFRIRHHLMIHILKVPIWWIGINKTILQISNKGKWLVQGEGDLDPKKTYILISNHVSWFDILLITSAFYRKLPMFKFFMKKELLWTLPFAGLACYFLDFPFLSRHTPEEIKKNPSLKGKDLETTRKACEKFKEFPTTIINFLEGTRFTVFKHQRQQSPYINLLKPKSGGLSIVLRELKNDLAGVIDVTVFYPGENLNLWDFVCGNFSKIILRYKVIPVPDQFFIPSLEERDARSQVQQWLNQLWAQKEILIKEFKKNELY